MRRMFVASVLAFAMLVGGTAVAAVRSEKVVGGPGNQYWPSSNGQHVAFAEFRRGSDNVFVSRLGATARTRINANDENGTLGTLMAGTDQVVFQQFRRHRSDLYFYDISTKRRWLVPRPVKSDKWEYWPAGSQEFILFLRWFKGDDHSELLLYDRVADDLQVLIDDIGAKTIFPGYAGAKYVAWSTCNRQTCWISYYDTETDTTTKLPLPGGKARYAPAIDEATGTIYFVESAADKCGRNVTLRMATIGVVGSTALATLPRTIDTGLVARPHAECRHRLRGPLLPAMGLPPEDRRHLPLRLGRRAGADDDRRCPRPRRTGVRRAPDDDARCPAPQGLTCVRVALRAATDRVTPTATGASRCCSTHPSRRRRSSTASLLPRARTAWTRRRGRSRAAPPAMSRAGSRSTEAPTAPRSYRSGASPTRTGHS